MTEVQSKYQQYKATSYAWREKNQAHVNEYYRNKRAEIKRLQTIEDNRLVVLEYIQQMSIKN